MEFSSQRIEQLKGFCSGLALEINNVGLLNRAFCHTSFCYENKMERIESYERLEFLGDAVLKLAISDILYKKFPKYQEGLLTEHRAAVVSDRVISKYAEKIGIQNLILTGKCEGNEKRESILACAFEALLGVIYLENNGYMRALSFLETNFLDEILNVDFSNPKAKLQDFTQKHSHTLPEYITVEEKGPAHNRTFVIAVYYENKFIAKGEAKTKKEAEFEAAKQALILLEGGK